MKFPRSLCLCALLFLGFIALSVSAQDEGEVVAEIQAEAAAATKTQGKIIVIEPVVYHVRFASAFLASVSMIIVSEFGDKTFFIAAIMAMRNSRLEVFSSAIAALALMTVLSAAMGQTLPAILDPKLTHYMATALFFFFGAKLLYEALQMDGGGDLKEELDEVEEELQAKEMNDDGGAVELLPGEGKRNSGLVNASKNFMDRMGRLMRKFFSKVFITCFSMTFLAEWGDRSQIATIALAAQKDAFGVTAGGIVGHSICTGVAVLGGKLLATRVSERTILLSGGVLFLIFGLHSIYYGEEH